jgi:hypothetical protein
MTEENNIPVEAVEIVEQVTPEETVTESVPETVEAPVVEQDNLTMDFSDLAPPTVPVQLRQEPDLVDEISRKILEKLQPKQEQALDVSDEEVVTKAELQKMIAQMQEQQQAEKIVNQTIAESKKIQDGYVTKLADTLSKNGIDINQDQSLRYSCDLLYRQMFQQKVQQLQRVAPVLTPTETHELVQEHFKMFNEIFLSNKIKKTAAPVNNLSPAGNLIQSQAQTAKATDEFGEFMKKKAEGNITISDIANILARPTQRK